MAARMMLDGEDGRETVTDVVECRIELRYWVFSVHHKLGMMIYNRHAPESPGHYRTGGGAEL